MARKDPFEWIKDKFSDNENVESIEIVSTNLLRIIRKDGPDLTVTKTNLDNFSAKSIKDVLSVQSADFILHSSKAPFVNGDAFDYLDLENKVLGGFGDLARVIAQDENWPYLPSGVHFIMRGLRQHSKVRKVRRLDHKRYEISRYDLKTVIIIALDDYDLGTESIRSAVDEFDEFHAVLKSNPNGQILSTAVTLADSIKIKVFKWGDLLRNLNFEWIVKK